MFTTSLFMMALTGCDYSGDWLFGGSTPGLPDVYELQAEGGGLFVPADITTVEELQAATIYGELGPPQTTGYGGATFEFVGTGEDVCIWLDPEVATWNQAVSERPLDANLKWTYPDNIYDDGDVDLLAGLSVYYTGSPGEVIGDFVVAYEDSLGNDIPISLAGCPNTEGIIGDDAVAGRGSPEFCTLSATDAGISYSVLLRTWSTPLDDDRLSYGLVLANGDCQALRALGGSQTAQQDECVIQGESLVPEPLSSDNVDDYLPYYGWDAASAHIYPRSVEFEFEFCNIDPGHRMRQFCNQERRDIAEAGLECLWNTLQEDDAINTDEKCYCGDPSDTPSGGAQ